MWQQPNTAIIAFDPGRTTGVCLAEGVDFAARTFHVTLSSEILWPDRRWVYSGLQRLKTLESTGKLYLTAIVIEDFRLFQDKANEQIGSDFPSVKVIERIWTCAELLELDKRIVMQMPGLRARVKIDPIHQKSLARSLHAQDAYRHLRYYVLMHKPGAKAKFGKGH